MGRPAAAPRAIGLESIRRDLTAPEPRLGQPMLGGPAGVKPLAVTRGEEQTDGSAAHECGRPGFRLAWWLAEGTSGGRRPEGDRSEHGTKLTTIFQTGWQPPRPCESEGRVVLASTTVVLSSERRPAVAQAGPCPDQPSHRSPSQTAPARFRTHRSAQGRTDGASLCRGEAQGAGPHRLHVTPRPTRQPPRVAPCLSPRSRGLWRSGRADLSSSTRTERVTSAHSGQLLRGPCLG